MKQIAKIEQSTASHWVGNGFFVRSAFSYDRDPRELSPFLLLDYAAPREFAPGDERRGVGAHPHRGFETVTIAYQGEVEHRDSHGGGGTIGPGDVQWMTAAAGLLHEEFHSPGFTRRGGVFEMVQLWVNLPAAHKSAAPGYQTLLKDQIPVVKLPDGGGQVRIIAGQFAGAQGPARTFTPLSLWDVDLRAGASAGFPLAEGHTAALLVLRGDAVVNPGPTPVAGQGEARAGDLVVFRRAGGGIALRATSDAKLLLMSGEPIDEPVVGYGPFVMNTRQEIEQAFADYQEGAMGELEA